MAENSSSAPGVAALATGIDQTGLGLVDGTVDVVAHDHRWAPLFEKLAIDIRAALAIEETAVQHIGSTAVAGMEAKPVLDVAVGVPASRAHDDIRHALSAIGTTFKGDLGVYGGLLFTIESEPGVVTSHIHVVDIDDFQWRWYLRFRDELRGDKALAADYASRKQAAAVNNASNRPAYTAAKSDWVLAKVMEIDGQPSER